MEERELSPDIMEATDSSPAEAAELLRQFGLDDCWKKSFRIKGNPNDTRGMNRYLDTLRSAGLNIDNGEAEFGYRMPLPERDAIQRDLWIFRRRIGAVIATAPEKPNKKRNPRGNRNFRKIK